jgi:cytochrome bd-type quinol oxidase subunit 2
MASRFVWVRLRLVFIALVISAGVIAIAILQWPQAVRSSGYGSGTYAQGPVDTMLLAALMVGIPAVLYAVVAYLGFSWLLFRPGEMERYRRHRIIASVEGSLEAVPPPTAPGRKFEN